MSPRPRWIPPWPWLAGAAVLVALVAVPFSVRAGGRAHLAAARAGLGGIEDVRRDAPPVDRDLQARWRRLVDRAGPGMPRRAPLRARVAEWMNGGGQEPQEARAAYDDDADLRAEALSLLSEGTPMAGALGSWLAAGGGPVDPRIGVRTENMVGIKEVGNLLLFAAAFEDDPGPALLAFDRADAAFARPATLVDAMIGLCLADARDETYCRMAAAGRLPSGAGDRWLAEEPPEPGRLLLGLRGERCLYLQPALDGLESGALPASSVFGIRVSAGNPIGWILGEGRTPSWWLHGAEASARVLEYEVGTEEALRGGLPLPQFPASDDAAGRLATELCPNMTAAATQALMARQRHRMARTFVRILRGGLTGGIEGGPLDFPLVVERVATGSLRVRVDVAPDPPSAWRGTLPSAPPLPSDGQESGFLWRYGLVEGAVHRTFEGK